MQEQQATENNTTTEIIDGNRLEIRSEGGRVIMNLDFITFVDLHELFRSMAVCAEADIELHQSTLNYAMGKFIASTPHYITENLKTLAYFNELATAIAKSQQIILSLQPVLSKHQH